LQQDQPPDELGSDESILTLHAPKRDKKQYVASVLVSANNEEKAVPTEFQVDTGASCSTLTLRDYKRITSTIPDQSDTKLKLYDQSVIHPVGSTKLYCTVNGLTKKVHFEIVEHASTSLLSGRASEALQLIHFNQEYLLQVNPSSDPTPLNQEQSCTNTTMYSLVLESYLVLTILIWIQMPKQCKKTPDVYQFQLKMSLSV